MLRLSQTGKSSSGGNVGAKNPHLFNECQPVSVVSDPEDSVYGIKYVVVNVNETTHIIPNLTFSKRDSAKMIRHVVLPVP
jgi:hypothetical protein